MALNTVYRIGLVQIKGATAGTSIVRAFLVASDAAFGASPFAGVINAGFQTNATEVRIGATSGAAASVTWDDVAIDTAALAGPSVYATTKTTGYSYDGLNRLTGETPNPGTALAYTYDRAGNRLTATGQPSLSYNAGNQVTNAGWIYDNAGNLTNDGTAHTYDALNRMTARGTTTYAYTGDGVLVSETTGGTTTRYTQDLAAPLSQVLQTRVGAGAWTSYLYGHERLASLATPRSWYLTDALGTVRRTVSDAGAIQGTAAYSAWGVPQGSLIAPFGFTGELQSGAGLTYLRARWYNASSGRFGSRDPFAGFAEQPYSLHSYQYGYANPVLYSDPSGRCVPYPINLLDPDCQFIGWNPVEWNWADGREYYYGPAGTIGKLALMALFPPAAYVFGVENAGLSYIRYNENPTECNGILVIVDTTLAVLPFASLARFGGSASAMAQGGTQILTAAQFQLLKQEVAVAAVGAGQIPNIFYSSKGDGSGDPSGRSVSGGSPYSGALVKVNNPDPAADALAQRIGGESRVRFANDPQGREFDVVSDLYIAQTKPAGLTLGSGFRNQAKATFEAAQATGRTPYFHFEGTPAADVLSQLQKYAQRYDILPIIDISSLP